ncbi:uncharacterized protein LOC128884200 isoform X2 [Hylaeus volcanicus]|nr:uncharacterized protein LOC128884200 isoform X2 [Hylaeus volcanicus]
MFIEKSSDELINNDFTDFLKNLFQKHSSIEDQLKYYEKYQKTCSTELLKSFYPRSSLKDFNRIKGSCAKTKGFLAEFLYLLRHCSETIQTNFFSLDTAELLFYKTKYNAVTITDAGLSSVGLGLYPFMNFINHSCHPNCTLIFKGTKLYVVALCEINAEDELTIGYTSPVQSFAKRQKILFDQYMFTCNCEFCNPASQLTKAYNLGCEEEMCRFCLLSIPLQGSLVIGSYDWFSQLARPSSEDFCEITKCFLNKPFYVGYRETTDTYECRRCGRTTLQFFKNLQNWGIKQMDEKQIASWFDELLCYITKKNIEESIILLYGYPEENGWKTCIATARLQRFRECIGKMTDFLYLLTKESSMGPPLKTLYISLMTLDIIVNKLAAGNKDLVTNLLQLRLSNYLRENQQKEKATILYYDALQNVGIFGNYLSAIHAQLT